MINLIKGDTSIEGTRIVYKGHIFLLSKDNKKLVLDKEIFNISYTYKHTCRIAAKATFNNKVIITKKILGLIPIKREVINTFIPFFDYEYGDGTIMNFNESDYSDAEKLHKALVDWIKIRISFYYNKIENRSFINKLI